MLEIDQVGTSDAIYPTFTKGVENEDVFDLPEECEDAGGCSWFSTCFAANHF